MAKYKNLEKDIDEEFKELLSDMNEKEFTEYFKRLFKEYFSWKTVVLFILVVLLIGSEVWVPMALGFIFDKTWLIGVGSSCWGFWLLPGTPFFPFCAALTIGIRKLQIRRKQQKERLALRY